MSNEQVAIATLAGAARVVVLTGVGFTHTWIFDAQAPSGMWTREPAAGRLFTLHDYIENPDIRRKAWQIRRKHAAWTARPHAGHYALVDFESTSRLHAIITKNVDGLQQLAGSSEQLVVELNGSLYEAECLSCGARSAMSDTLERVVSGEDDPACLRCGGILKAGTTSVGQPPVARVLARAQAAVSRCDVLVSVGTALHVQPETGLVDTALRHGADLVIIHPEATRYDKAARVRIGGTALEVLPAIVAAVPPVPRAAPPRASAG